MRVDVPGLARTRVRRLTSRRDADRMHFDSDRLPAPRRAAEPRRVRVGRRRSRRRPATCSRSPAYGPRRLPAARRPQHAARLRPRRRPRQAVHGRAGRRRRVARSPPATRRSRSPARRCGSGCCASRRAGAGARSPTSISAAGRGCRRSAACARAASGPPRSRSRRASRSTGSARNSARSTSAASSSIRRSSTRSASTPGSSYKNAPFAWSPGTGSGAWGVFVHTPGMVTHGVGHPDWSHRSYAVRGRRRGARPLPVRRRHAGRRSSTRYTQLTGRAPAVPLWSLGLWVSRAYYKTPEEAAAVAAQAARAADSLRRADARRPRGVERRDALRFRVGRGRAIPIRTRRSRAIKAHNLRVCVWEYPYVSIHSPLFQRARVARATC